jgi:hypothetical protein
MNIDIPAQAKVSDILNAVKAAEEGSHIYCSSERHFSLLKICLIKLQKTDLNIYQLDPHGFTIKQVSTKRKAAAEPRAVEIEEAVGSTAAEGVELNTDAPEQSEQVAPGACQNQSVAKEQEPQPVQEQGMTSRQISAIRDLEQSLRRCKELELLVIGFSDGLVAVPEALGYGTAAISSAEALEVESFDVYHGYEADKY